MHPRAYNKYLLTECISGALQLWKACQSSLWPFYSRTFPSVCLSPLKQSELLPNHSLYSEHDNSHSSHPWLRERKEGVGSYKC